MMEALYFGDLQVLRVGTDSVCFVVCRWKKRWEAWFYDGRWVVEEVERDGGPLGRNQKRRTIIVTPFLYAALANLKALAYRYDCELCG